MDGMAFDIAVLFVEKTHMVTLDVSPQASSTCLLLPGPIGLKKLHQDLVNDVARLKDEKSQADGFRFDVLFRRRTGVCAFGALVSNDKKYWLFAVVIWRFKLPSQPGFNGK